VAEHTDAPDLGYVHRWEPREGAARTLLLLHGTGGDENDLIPLGDLLDPTANLLSLRGPVMEHGMPRFFRRLAAGVFDMEDLHARAQALADFVGAAAAHYGFDARGVTAVGFSNGANIAAAVMLLRPEVLRRAILLRAMVPLEPESPPDLAGVEVFVAAGRQDQMIPPEGTERLTGMLREFGADVTLEWFPVGHQLTRADVDAARDWLRAR
jgi:predicted esterase